VNAAAGTGTYYGPSALGEDLRRFVNLTWMLAVTDYKMTYFGSLLGYFWSLLRPLMFFGILYVVFTHIVDLGDQVKHYPAYLLTAIVLWMFFEEATSAAVASAVNRENLLRKVRFPRMVIPFSVVLTALFRLLGNLLAVFVFLFSLGIEPRWSWLELPVLIAILVVLSIGFSMLLSALFVRFRDIGQIWDVFLRALFYGSPILYTVGMAPDSVERILGASPIASVLTEMRHAMIDPAAPTAAEALGGAERLLVPAGAIVVSVLVGLWVFNRETPRLAENL
jgi:ABC-2 type transport system permease protein